MRNMLSVFSGKACSHRVGKYFSPLLAARPARRFNGIFQKHNPAAYRLSFRFMAFSRKSCKINGKFRNQESGETSTNRQGSVETNTDRQGSGKQHGRYHKPKIQNPGTLPRRWGRHPRHHPCHSRSRIPQSDFRQTGCRICKGFHGRPAADILL